MAGGARRASIRVAMKVTLPDGTALELPDGATGADAAAAIGAGLARAALASRSTGELRDLARPLADGAPVSIVTPQSPEALDLIRHDTAHVLAAAILDLYPGVKISIGPPIEDGFYYDFEFPEGVTISEADFPAHRGAMRAHVKADEPFVREDVSVEEALERFRAEHQHYKVELIEDLVANGGRRRRSRSTPTARSPTSAAGRTRRRRSASGPSSLQSVAGAYWRGDSDRQMLTRIYGTAFFSKEELDEPPRARSSRRGPAITASSAASSGCSRSPSLRPAWRSGCRPGPPCSTQLVALNRRMQSERGYVEVKTPQLYESAAVGDLRALGQVQGEHLRHASTRTGSSASSR